MRLGLPAAAVDALAAAATRVQRAGERLVLAEVLDGLAARARTLVAAHHAAAPLEFGVSRQTLRPALVAPLEVADAVLERLEEAGVLVRDAGLVRLAAWRPAPTVAQQRVAGLLLARPASVGPESPTTAELVREFGSDVPALPALAEREEVIVALDRERYCAADAFRAAAAPLASRLTRGELYTPSVLRETLGVSRKHLMPALEYFDGARLTERLGDARRWRGALALHVPHEALDIG